jgi:hypothetical protein
MTVGSDHGSGIKATDVEDAKPPALDETHHGEFFIGGEWRKPETVPSAAIQDAAP